MLAGANIIYGLGMLEMGMTISYSQLLMDAEMAEMMLFSMDGIVVNDETLSVDVIKEVGPRSDFLAHMNTFENMYIQSKPKLIDRLTRDRWNEALGSNNYEKQNFNDYGNHRHCWDCNTRYYWNNCGNNCCVNCGYCLCSY